MFETLIFLFVLVAAVLICILLVRAIELSKFRSEKRFQKGTPGVADLLPWAAEIDDGIIVCKNGAFCSSFIYSPKDAAFSTPEERELCSQYLNNAVKGLGNGWVIHVDAVRRASPGYPTPERNFFPDRVSRAIDEERRRLFASKGVMFESYFIITLTYKPPMLVAQKITEMMFDDDKAKLSLYRALGRLFTNGI